MTVYAFAVAMLSSSGVVGVVLKNAGFSAVLLVALGLLFFLAQGIYNLYLHPLSSYPGPKTWTFSIFPAMLARIRGKSPFIMVELHGKYGSVVRIAPDELSYIDAEAWSDIYASKPGRGEMPKNPRMRDPTANGQFGLFDHPTAEGHRKIRKSVAGGFSEKALREQESRIMSYVDLLMQRFEENSAGGPIDVARWFALATFDVMGDLTFGEDFEGLRRSRYHRWIEIIFNFNTSIVLISELRRLWPLNKIFIALMPAAKKKEAVDTRAYHLQFSINQLNKRIAMKESRPDFMTYALKNLNKPDGLNRKELERTCEALVIAGSDTTANLLTGCIYHVLRNPTTHETLRVEIRTAFKTASEITMTSVNKLPYLLAVLNEALRIHPPAPGHHSRRVGTTGATIAGKHVPPGTFVAFAHWAAYHSEKNWHRALEFLPERWLAGGSREFERDDRAGFQPFSVGPRNCIGMNLANAESRVVLARLMHRFDLELVDPVGDWVAGQEARLLWSKKELWVRFVSVER